MNNQSSVHVQRDILCACAPLPKTILFLKISVMKRFPAETLEYFTHVQVFRESLT